MNIDPINKTIEIENSIDATVLYSTLKKRWVLENSLITLPFPIKHIEGDKFVFINDWRFESLESHNNVSPKIGMNEPEYPLVPSKTMLYEIKKFGKICTLEEFLSSCPKEINTKSTHIEVSEDGEICLTVRGHWPNIHFERENTEFKKKLSKWQADFEFYSAIR
jgi:hypothetical protein